MATLYDAEVTVPANGWAAIPVAGITDAKRVIARVLAPQAMPDGNGGPGTLWKPCPAVSVDGVYDSATEGRGVALSTQSPTPVTVRLVVSQDGEASPGASILYCETIPLQMGRTELVLDRAPTDPHSVRLSAIAVTPNDPPGSPGATYFPVERIRLGGLMDRGDGTWVAFVWNTATGESWEGPGEVTITIYEA